jgi:lycopene cyclase domain-containing protein
MWLYLLSLCFSLAGLALLDYRYKLAFWNKPRQTTWTIFATVTVFIVWDIIGILLGIFFHGGSPWTLPVRILPEFPIEELFFLTLLCYVTLLLYRGLDRK